MKTWRTVIFSSLTIIALGFLSLCLISPINPFTRHLVILTNEAETRPCGGFVSAYGTFRVFPPQLELKNSYTLNQSLGKAPTPLSKVAQELHFWDLGTSPNTKTCSDKFLSSYNQLTNENLNQILLINFGMIQDLIKIIGPIQVGETILDHKNLFAHLSRTVANVDRHNEEALHNRKAPLRSLGKALITKTITSPTKWFPLYQRLNHHFATGELYHPKNSPSIAPQKEDFAVIEWNLGGAKTSRFLKKTLKISARETFPGQWQMGVKFAAKNLGGIDEPLSQTWKGEFHLHFPEFLEKSPALLMADLPPGEMIEQSWVFEGFDFAEISEYQKGFSVFTPRGQNLFIDFDLALFPQQSFSHATFPHHENIGTKMGKTTSFREVFHWETKKDKTRPFPTLHEIIPGAKEGRLRVEVHTNEQINPQSKIKAHLTDLNHTNPTTDHPQFTQARLLEDQRTLLLTFTQKEAQAEERYLLKLEGIRDVWGNEIDSEQGRTVIDRR